MILLIVIGSPHYFLSLIERVTKIARSFFASNHLTKSSVYAILKLFMRKLLRKDVQAPSIFAHFVYLFQLGIEFSVLSFFLIGIDQGSETHTPS